MFQKPTVAKKPEFKESSTFDWNSIRSLVEREKNGFIKTHLILSCIRNRSSNNKENNVGIDECELLLFKFIHYFSYGKLFPNFVANYKVKDEVKTKGKVSKKEKIVMENKLKFQQGDFQMFKLGEGFEMMTSLNRFNYEVCKFLYLLYWNVEILKGIRDKRNVPPLIILDGCISLNRMMARDVLKNRNYIEGFRNLQNKVNTLMNENFYTLLFKNPKLLLHSSYQNYDSEIKLYPEQLDLIDNITTNCLNDTPLLMGTSLPTGQGKTFAAICLAKKLSIDAPSKTLLFACSNSLVNNQVSADCFNGDGLHLWLAKREFYC